MSIFLQAAAENIGAASYTVQENRTVYEKNKSDCFRSVVRDEVFDEFPHLDEDKKLEMVYQRFEDICQ